MEICEIMYVDYVAKLEKGVGKAFWWPHWIRNDIADFQGATTVKILSSI